MDIRTRFVSETKNTQPLQIEYIAFRGTRHTFGEVQNRRYVRVAVRKTNAIPISLSLRRAAQARAAKRGFRDRICAGAISEATSWPSLIGAARCVGHFIY